MQQCYLRLENFMNTLEKNFINNFQKHVIAAGYKLDTT